MDVILAGTGEAFDVDLLIYGIAFVFGVIAFLLLFPSWRRRRLRAQRDAAFVQQYEDNMRILEGQHAASRHEGDDDTGAPH
ncbi:MAG: hypothetical protein RBU27_10295 [Bacteroidota bacterium]|jgi:hypothetical protein|nr:hypothetical protein [Bacteroidota bacterium]